MVEVWLLLGIGVFFDSPLCGANSWVNASLPSLFLPSRSPPGDLRVLITIGVELGVMSVYGSVEMLISVFRALLQNCPNLN